MSKRLTLANLSIGQKMLAALLGLLAAVLLVVNVVFVSAAYWIAQQSIDPQALQSIGRLVATPAISRPALASEVSANTLLDSLADLAPLRAAALYSADGQRLAVLQLDAGAQLPEQFAQVAHWRHEHSGPTQVIELEQVTAAAGHLLLVGEQQLSPAFYQGTVTASLLILALSLLLWLVVARQVRTLVTKPIRRLEELSRQVTNQENYNLRARPGNKDELGSLAEAFNTMLTRIQAREDELKRARDDAQTASDEAQQLTKQTRHSNRKLEMEVQVRNKIEKKLTGFQNYLNSIINSMPSALIALDEQLYVTQWNQEASRLSGTPLNKALNQPIFLAFPSLKPYLEQLKHTSERHTIEKIERVTWFKDQQPQHYALTFYPLVGSSGRGAVIRIDDIGQRLAMEDLMVQSEKMLSVGGLAAGMAHEINNPLGAILHNVQNIRRRLSSELAKNLTQAAESGVELAAINDYLERREIPQLLDGIQQAGARAAKIVSHMLSFSRLSSRELNACQLPQLINQAVEIAGNDFDLTEGFDFKGLEIQREFDPLLGSVPATANELEQVLLNLLKNAAQAIHQRPAGQTPGRIILRCKLSPPWAEIQVEDNGVGMPEAVRKRIFEPFFTTKEIGQGTGLGLSVAYFIITNNHKGQMEVHSKLGQGSCFSVRLPLQLLVDQQGV
ncbi:MAG: HAMP domain-containing protein [Pseudomonadaceae bacterium]|nr:HAMP domain-containing protein [Pseudomonadaceae bacterium]